MSVACNHVFFVKTNMLEFIIYIKYNLKINDTLTPNGKDRPTKDQT